MEHLLKENRKGNAWRFIGIVAMAKTLAVKIKVSFVGCMLIG
jgi:hypothetical protein